MNLIIDIGNTFTKIAIYSENELIYFQNNIENDYKSIVSESYKVTEQYGNIKRAIISSVLNENNLLEEFLINCGYFVINLTNKTLLPIKNLYKTPETLGKDRIAAVVGANNIFPDTNVLIFDAGTALTVDFVNLKNEYEGGNISPGLTMRYKALNEFTEKLPLFEVDTDFNKLFGQTTQEAIKAGVQNSIIFEINNYISVFKEKYTDLKVILTGGDVFFFDKNLKKNIFAETQLVLIGLNRILEYNAQKD